MNSIILLESGLGDEEEETESEYSGDVTSWWSRDDSIEILSSVYGNFSLEIEDRNHLDLARTNHMMWTKDNLCRSFGLTLPKVSTVLSSFSSIGDLAYCDNYKDVLEHHIDNNFESETVDSIEYISLYQELSEGDEGTLVMYLSSDQEEEEEARYELSDVLAIWHKLHQTRHLVTDKVFR